METPEINPDREPEDPVGDDDENAPGDLFNECTETIYDDGENDDDD